MNGREKSSHQTGTIRMAMRKLRSLMFMSIMITMEITKGMVLPPI